MQRKVLTAWVATALFAASAAVADEPLPRKFFGLKELNPPADPQPAETQAVVGATLIDGRGGLPIPDATVVWRGSKIVAAGPRATVAIPGDASVMNVAGLTILPGLIDAHFHTSDEPANIRNTPPLFLSHGVTTLREPGRPIAVYDPVFKAEAPMPRLFLTGPHFDQSPPAWPNNAVIIPSPDEARKAVDRYVAQGASAIKVYYRLPLDSIEATCAQAHQHRIPVTAHLELVDADAAIRAGLDGIEHVTSFGTLLAEPQAAEEFRQAVARDNEARQNGRYRLWADLDLDRSPRVAPLIKLMVERRIWFCPTLATFERRDGDRGAGLHHVRGFENMLKFVGLCHRAGVPIVVGSHTFASHAEFGWAYQRELELLVEAGLSPLAAIAAGTGENARFLGCAERLGTIEPGRQADLVLVSGEPHADIKAMYKVRNVILNGNWVGERLKTENR